MPLALAVEVILAPSTLPIAIPSRSMGAGLPESALRRVYGGVGYVPGTRGPGGGSARRVGARACLCVRSLFVRAVRVRATPGVSSHVGGALGGGAPFLLL